MSANQHYRNLRVLFKWLAREEERLGPDPMARVDPPKVTEKIKNVLTEGQSWRSCLRACEGSEGEEHRRDTAIVRLLIDCGARVSRIANIYAKDVNLSRKTILIVLKV